MTWLTVSKSTSLALPFSWKSITSKADTFSIPEILNLNVRNSITNHNNSKACRGSKCSSFGIKPPK